MLFTIFCCISTGLCVYCILNRVNKRDGRDRGSPRGARDGEGIRGTQRHHGRPVEHQGRRAEEGARQGTAAREAARGRSLAAAGGPAAKSPAKAAATAKSAKEKLKSEGLEVFAMSRPFTDTQYDALLAATEVVKVEGKAL